MTKRLKKWGFWTIVLVIALSVLYFGVEKWLFWNVFVRPVVWQNWNVALPQGGSLGYRNQSPKTRLAGPADTEKFLVWVKPNGAVRECPISNGGGGYRDIEFRLRQDGRGVWLIDWNDKRIAATLDFNSGRFTGEEGIVYDEDGVQNESALLGHPAWARLRGGRSLGRKKFW